MGAEIENVITIHQSHDAGWAWNVGNRYYALQFEKVNCKRYSAMINRKQVDIKDIKRCIEIIKETLPKGVKFDRYLRPMPTDWFVSKYGEEVLDVHKLIMSDLVKEDGHESLSCLHHKAHAAVGFYGSPFEEAIIITTDGGGDGEWLTISHGGKGEDIVQLSSSQMDLGGLYQIGGRMCEDIYESYDLSIAGKAMGIMAGGELDMDVVNAFVYLWDNHMLAKANKLRDVKTTLEGWKEYYQDPKWRDQIDIIFGSAGIDPNNPRYFRGLEQNNLMLNVQKAFEILFDKTVDRYMDPKLPIVLSGGCALNVVNNERLKSKWKRPIYVPPCPGDEGLAMGVLLEYHKPESEVRLHDLCPELYDELNEDGSYEVNDLRKKYTQVLQSTEIDNQGIIDLLEEGNVIGYIQGPSEFGPRALGFRSILCDPTDPDMKDKINHKIKHREWFRPFAPLCRAEKATKYFESENFNNMEYMSFAPMVKEEMLDVIPAVVHKDRSSRLQTVTRDSNKAMYDLLGLWDKDVLLNTSFNIHGRPIVNTINEALWILLESELDAVVINNRLFVAEKRTNSD